MHRHHRTRNRLALLAATAAATLALAGCGGPTGWPTAGATSEAAPPPTAAPDTAQQSGGATGVADPAGSSGGGGTSGGSGTGTPGGGSGPPGTSRCTTAELRASLGPADGAAGSVNQTLILTNVGGRTCTLRGFPGVSYTQGSGHARLGPSAAMDGPRGRDVRLGVGGSAGAALRLVDVRNYDADVCKPTPSNGLRVYPPGDTASLIVAREGTGCAGTPPGDQLTVRTLRAR